MEFQVIPDEQTPNVPEIEDIESFFTENTEKLWAFREYAESLENAAGLAANQCSVDGERLMLRVFALREDGVVRLIIDPHITEYVGIKELKAEGCLTWRGKKVIAERSRSVRVAYYGETGKLYHLTYKGFLAQVWQHEINHLNGVPEQIEDYDYQVPKPIEAGRNEKCPCGSGLKYKHCCII